MTGPNSVWVLGRRANFSCHDEGWFILSFKCWKHFNHKAVSRRELIPRTCLLYNLEIYPQWAYLYQHNIFASCSISLPFFCLLHLAIIYVLVAMDWFEWTKKKKISGWCSIADELSLLLVLGPPIPSLKAPSSLGQKKNKKKMEKRKKYFMKLCIYFKIINFLSISLNKRLLVSSLFRFAGLLIHCIIIFFINVMLWAEWSQNCMRVTERNSVVVFLGIFQGLQVFKLIFLPLTFARTQINMWMLISLFGKISFCICSDRFIGLSPNSVDVLLKVSWYLYYGIINQL